MRLAPAILALGLSCTGAPDATPPYAAVLVLLDAATGDPAPIAEAAKALEPGDCFGLGVFDLRVHWALPFARVPLRESLKAFTPESGTDLKEALTAGLLAFRGGPPETAPRKHIVLVSDGDSATGSLERLYSLLGHDQITVSTICVSSKDFDAVLMSTIATRCGGRFMFTNRKENLPRLVTQEIRKALRDD